MSPKKVSTKYSADKKKVITIELKKEMKKKTWEKIACSGFSTPI